MTSLPPAQPKPPPLPLSLSPPLAYGVAGPPQLNRSVPFAGLQSPVKRDDEDSADDVQFIDSRPAKRRKLSNAEAASQPAVTSTHSSPVVGSHGAGKRFVRAGWPPRSGHSLSKTIEPSRIQQAMPTLMPRRPWKRETESQSARQDVRPTGRVRKNVAVPTVPDSMPLPEDAPKFDDGRKADYFPWTGKHPEDNLNENTVRSGHYDRAPNPAEKELNTAKAPLYNASKHRSGLETLSALFALIVNRQQGRDAFSSVSSFRGPPPRVTLTETKRRSWIADLADLEVPLKRLSKTIPQGIRGQPLLDQCLVHLVPLNRALWFIKCVGANEIRTLKRKGINAAVAHAAEAKWLREWTVNTEQFVESLMSQLGQPGWKERINYALQLVTRLYAENLMDRDHYLDWVVKCFSSATIDLDPFWLMVVRLYKVDLLAFRKRGRQVAEAMVLKLNAAQQQSSTVFEPWTQRLTHLVHEFVSIRPTCFLNPDRWEDCWTALRICYHGDQNAEVTILQPLRHSNERVRSCHRPDGEDPLGPTERVVHILDLVEAPFDMHRLIADLNNIVLEQTQLMAICVRWAISQYRTGLARVYLIARVLRRFRQQGFAVDTFLLDFLPRQASLPAVNLAALRHLTSELSRSHTFSLTRYLQWLTVRGLPRKNTFSPGGELIATDPLGQEIRLQMSTDPSQLLTECCLFGYADHVHNLRLARLAQGGYDDENEAVVTNSCQQYLQRQFDHPADTVDVKRKPDFAKLPWSVRTSLSHFLRAQMVTLIRSTLAQSMQPPDHQQSQRIIKRFYIIRGALEQLEDISVLADVLRSAAVVKQETVLASVADTINRHAKVLSVMGALEPLQELICQAYLTLRPVKTALPLLATSLIDLCRRFPSNITPIQALRQDLVRGDRSRAIAACSPFSDGVAESLQQAGESFYEDFEAILQTESNMTDATSTQLFELLVARILKLHQESEDDKSQRLRLYQLLHRFQLSKQSRGETLLTQWLTRPPTAGVEPIGRQLVVGLIATRCLCPSMALSISSKLPEQHTFRVLIYRLVRETFVSRSCFYLEDDLEYAFGLALTELIVSKPAEVFEILVSGGDAVTSRIPTTVIVSTVLDGDAVQNLSPTAAVVLKENVCRLLDLPAEVTSTVDQVRSLVQTIGPLSIPFSQLKLRMLCQDVGSGSDEVAVDVLADTVCSCLNDHENHMGQLPGSVRTILRALGPAINARVRVKVDHSFFQALPRFLQNKTISHFPLPSSEEDAHAAEALSLVRLVSTDIGTAVHNNAAGLLIEKLSIYLKCLGTSGINSTAQCALSGSVSSPSAPTAPAAPSPDTTRAFLMSTVGTLDAMMQMVCIKRASLNPAQSQPSPAAAKQSQQDQIKLVGLILTVATHPAWSLLTAKGMIDQQRQKISETANYMFEVAATLVDDMAEESRVFCARLLKEKIKDPRVKWLLGNFKMFGSQQFTDLGSGLEIHNDNKSTVSEFKPKHWEMLEGSGGSNDSYLGLGLFSAIRI